MTKHYGFTLIELLVVVTIIVVLLALLTPALDKAVYQAQLVVCASRLDLISSSATTYAMANTRAYPNRPGLDNGKHMQPHKLSEIRYGGYDGRQVMSRMLDLKLLQCPLTDQVDLYTQDPQAVVFSSYYLWIGFGYVNEHGMMRMGDRFTWRGTSFNYLATDLAVITASSDDSQASHPDHNGVMDLFTRRGDVVEGSGTDSHKKTFSLWFSFATRRRGPVDLNFASSDGAVVRGSDVSWDDGTPGQEGNVVKVPHWSDINDSVEWGVLPR